VSTSDDLDSDNRANDIEKAERLNDAYYIHAFVIPNYDEPEPLLRDTIKRLENHRFIFIIIIIIIIIIFNNFII
jgi:hypothetical protein